jgi:serine/threonine protein kinase
MPNHFLAAGVYGCVYYPGYNCKGKPMKKKKWVSKLTYQNEKTTAEIEIGHLLKKIPNYQEHFIVAENSCIIPYKSLSEMKEGCDLIKKGQSYTLLYSRYAKSMELHDYLQNKRHFVRIPRFFFQLCDSIQLMIEQHVVHHDLHFSNILYAKDTSNLLIIDFGLAIHADRFHQTDYLKEVFTRFMPEWNWYALEIHMLTYLIHHGPLNEQVIHHTIHAYLDKHMVFNTYPLVRSQYKKDATEYYLQMIYWTREECIEHLLAFWKTWDYYEIALRFLFMYAENKVNFPAYLEHLLTMIYANPEKRPNVLQLRNAREKVIQTFDLSESRSSYVSTEKSLLILSVGKN